MPALAVLMGVAVSDGPRATQARLLFSTLFLEAKLESLVNSYLKHQLKKMCRVT